MTPLIADALAAQQLPEARISWLYAAEAIFFVFVAIALIKWIRKTLFEIGPSARPSSTSERLALESIDNQAAKHLIERGLISTEALMAMSERERSMLLVATARQIGAPPPTSVAAPTPRPAQTVTLHCPLCGTALTTAPQPIPFVAKCDGCDKRIQVRGDGVDRLSIVVSEAKTG